MKLEEIQINCRGYHAITLAEVVSNFPDETLSTAIDPISGKSNQKPFLEIRVHEGVYQIHPKRNTEIALSRVKVPNEATGIEKTETYISFEYLKNKWKICTYE